MSKDSIIGPSKSLKRDSNNSGNIVATILNTLVYGSIALWLLVIVMGVLTREWAIVLQYTIIIYLFVVLFLVCRYTWDYHIYEKRSGPINLPSDKGSEYEQGVHNRAAILLENAKTAKKDEEIKKSEEAKAAKATQEQDDLLIPGLGDQPTTKW